MNHVLSVVLGIGILAFASLVNSEESPRCRFQEFRCLDGSACLASEKLCNGVEDCPQGEDERGNEQWDCSRIHLNSDCGDQHKFFKCRFGGCVPRKAVCDGKLDCWGGTDESTNLCGETGLRPAPNVIPASVPGAKPGPPLANQRPVAPPRERPPPPPARERPQPQAPPRPALPAVQQERTPRPQVLRPAPQQSPARPRPTAVLPPPDPEPEVAFAPAPNPGQTQSPPNSGPLCPSLDVEEGVNVKCELNKRPASCDPPANGTIAYFTCKDHYSPTQNAPRMTRRLCKNGKWTRRNPKWYCNLECGVGGRQPSQFIVGGVTSSIGKWPWHVGFYRQDPPGSGKWEYFCGGTLISSKVVLTAAHCVVTKEGRPFPDLKLFFGKFYRDVNRNDQYVQERDMTTVSVNDYYNSQTYASDIALVAVDRPLEITDRVKPACLPNEMDIESGDFGTLVGWGRYSDNSYPQELQEASLPVITFKNCQRAHPSLEALVKADSFCAGYRNGTSPCDGDSGSGLVSAEDASGNRWSIYGIVSAGVAKRGGGCDPKYYTIFTRVFKFRNWIDSSLDTQFRRRRSVAS